MTKVIRLTTEDIYEMVGRAITNKKNYFQKGVNLLEFAKRLYIIDYKQNNKSLDIEEQRMFIDDLLPHKPKTMFEYRRRFDNNLLTESDRGTEHITNFFDFLIENAVPLNEGPRKKPVTPANVNTIMQNLHKAFDGAGTEENLAVKTIKMINTKDVLTKVDQTIAKTVGKKYPKIKTLAAWINDEMSEIDPKQYDAIWGHLTKMGYKGKESNKFLRVIGKSKEIVQKAWDWTKKSVIGKFFNSLRNAANSGVGIAVQLMIDAIGPDTLGVAFAIPEVVWGLIVNWDYANLALGTPEWLNLIFDTLCLLTLGTMSTVLAPFTKAAKGAVFSSLEKVFMWLSKSSFGRVIQKFLPAIEGNIGKAGGFIVKASEWVGSKFKKLIGEEMAALLKKGATKAKGWLTGFVETVMKWFGKGETVVGKNLLEKGIEKVAEGIRSKVSGWLSNPAWLEGELGKKFVEKGLKPAIAKNVQKYATDPIKKYGVEKATEFVDKKYGPLYGDLIRCAELAHKSGKESKDLLKNLKTFKNDLDIQSMQKVATSIESTTSELGNLNQQGNKVISGIRSGTEGDNNQYKKQGEQFFYASKQENPPQWKPVTNPKSVTYLKTNIYRDFYPNSNKNVT